MILGDKRFLVFCLCVLFAWPAPAPCQESPPRALFVSVIQDPPVLSSREAIGNLIGFAKKSRVQTLFVQVYRANQAWFSSKVNVSEDSLRLLIREAHAAGMEVHAWLNLLSLSANTEAPLLKKYGPEILTRNTKEKKTLEDYKIDDQYFLEPGDGRVRDELLTIVGELVRAYPELDGIQFDYIRYPDLHPAYGHTKVNEDHFKKATGLSTIEEESPAWKDWKRDQVTGLLEALAQEARAMHPGIQVSTTALAPYSRATLEAFQDWGSWIRKGTVDFVTLMCYSADIQEFQYDIEDARRRIGDLKKINIAVGAYALVGSPGTFQAEFALAEKSGARACAVLHYGSLLENPALDLS